MDMAYRVLQIITLSEYGGAQQVLFDIVTNLDKNKYNVEVACAPGGELVKRLREKGVSVHEFPALKRNISPVHDFKAFITLYRLIRKEGYEIVHCHSTKAGLLGRIAAKLAGTPRIFFTVHGWGFYNIGEYRYMHNLLIFLEKVSTSISTKVVCVSNKVKKDGLEKQIGPKDKFVVIHSGTNWNPSGRREELRQELGVKKGEVLFGMVARLAYPKNPLLFLKAAKKVTEEDKSAKFAIIGDGPLYSDCKNFIRENTLEERVSMLGFRNARCIIQDLDVFVLTSQSEGLPMTIIEAMFAGLPIIATDVGGVSELVQNGENGFLFNPNADELAEKMIYLIANSDMRVKMGEKSQKKAEENFRVDKMVKEYGKIYAET